MRSFVFRCVPAAIASLLIVIGSVPAICQEMPFGGPKDVDFAQKTWKAMGDYTSWKMKSGFYPGQSPHGEFLRIYYNMIDVDGKPYHIIVKDNFGGEGATLKTVSDAPDKYLMAVTIMLQREEGYDPKHNNWFWVKYRPDGSVFETPKGVALAGRVAEGTDQGCIACHARAKGGDYMFSNDR